MTSLPTHRQLVAALYSAQKAHHEFESNFLGGKRHIQWAGWYAAYVLGRLGDFSTPTLMTHWLEDVLAEEHWAKNAADYILRQIEMVK